MTDETNLKNFAADFISVETAISKAVIGQKDIIRNVLASVIAGGHALLEGLPGLGKTHLVKSFGKALDLSFSRVQFTPDLMPADITGTDVYENGFSFRKGPVFTNLLLADEINRATPKTQSALLEAMQEKTVTVGKNTYDLPFPFFTLATQNPIELEGVYPLPEAQLDRFFIKLDVTFPSQDELLEIVNITSGENPVWPEKTMDSEKIKAMSLAAASAPMARAVGEYAMKIVFNTHPDKPSSPETVKKYVRFGASPRGAQSLVALSKIYALLDGRFNVAYDDVKKAAPHVLRHRISLNFEAAAEGVSSDNIIDDIISEITR
ncbi:MAG: AAA family ATPase [Clostridiales bacterium]|jgi:MoxR-like ATPase|nr:AAA family ATPase [Clostridiales bacterium]